ncbi:MAG: TonB-dependent receptor [Caulobacteraceae bacterium]|nr:TonB-dependent receptor [Caulobacteraceae bacterium]
MTKFAFAAALACAAPGLAWAADSAPDDIVVVANRAPQPLYKVGNSVTLIDQGAIQSSQAVPLAELLVQTPGVALVRNGGEGQPTSIFIRGADSDQTLVLVDGVQLNDPSQPSGGFDFANLLAGDVSRVEVLRGAHSTLWGSQAIGGVVDVVTAEPPKGLEADGAAEAGSRDTQYYRLGMGGTLDRLSFRLAGGYYATAGISAFDRAFGGRETDGYTDTAFSGRLRYDLTPDVQIDLRGYYTRSRVAYDGYDTPNYAFGDDGEYSKTTQYILYGGVNFGLFGGRLKNRLALQYSDTDRALYDPNYAPVTQTFYGYGKTTRVEYQGTWAISERYQAVFGAQHERSTLTTDTPAYDVVPSPQGYRATLDSGYVQVQGEVLRGLTLTAGARHDQHDTFGGHDIFQAAAAWTLNDGNTILRVSFGQGFKAPALYQLFSAYGNRALRPETADSWDAGIEQRLWSGRAKISATYFGRASRDLIGFFDCTTPAPLCATEPYGYYANIARATAQGVELEASVRPLARLSLTANYTYTDSEDARTHKALARRPQDAANLSVSYDWPLRLNTTLALRYAGRSFDDAANLIPLKAYALTDLRASYPLTARLELYGRIENLFDQHYETAYQYGSVGRGVFAGIRARF